MTIRSMLSFRQTRSSLPILSTTGARNTAAWTNKSKETPPPDARRRKDARVEGNAASTASDRSTSGARAAPDPQQVPSAGATSHPRLVLGNAICITYDRWVPVAGAASSTDLVPGAGATPLPVQISSLSNVFMAPFIARACLVGELPQRPHSKSNEQQYRATCHRSCTCPSLADPNRR